MKPISPHWADQTAVRIVGARGEKNQYVLAAGITPSGKIHIGNFREVITVDLVARALRALGKNVRFIYSWDNFDTFRKVPKNVPDPKAFEPYLRQPIARIPDPWGEAENYAAGRMRKFEDELTRVGIEPEFLYQEAKYAAGDYSQNIRQALEKREQIREILNEHRSQPLPESWLPTSIYCEKCQKDEMQFERYEGEWRYAYACASCGHQTETDIRNTQNLKLAWRTDWPMRWAYEKVDFEPGGKDHSSEGGSYDTAKKIVQAVWEQPAPIYLQYDFVAIKGGAGKMSSSSGELYTLDEVLEVYAPQIVRWLFANQRPNHDFSFAFDEDVIKLHDEFDRAERQALGPCPEKPGKWPLIRRTYELSLVSEVVPARPPFRPAFRELCNRLQICNHDIQRTRERYYQNDIATAEDRDSFEQRASCAVQWLEKHAPESFRYRLQDTPRDIEADPEVKIALNLLRELLSQTNLDSIPSGELHERIYETVIRKSGSEPKAFFLAVYQKLIGRDQGPKLANFLKEIGTERLLKLL